MIGPDQLAYLVLGAVLALSGALALWLLKDRLMIFGNIVYWADSPFGGAHELPKKEGEYGSRHILTSHVVLQVRALNDQVLNTRIQLKPENEQINIRPPVPFSFSKDKPGELIIPQLPSGVYMVSMSENASMALTWGVQYVLCDNARAVKSEAKIQPFDYKGRRLMSLGLVMLVIAAVALLTFLAT